MKLNVFELLLAIAVVGAVFFALFQAIANSIKDSRTAMRKTDAEAKFKSERARNLEEAKRNSHTVTPALCTTLHIGKGMTTLQRMEEYEQKCKGKWVLWLGSVVDVDHECIKARVHDQGHDHILHLWTHDVAKPDPTLLQARSRLRIGDKVNVCGRINCTNSGKGYIDIWTDLDNPWIVDEG